MWGPVPHPSPELPVSPALLLGGPGGGCGGSAGGRLYAPSPLTSWGTVPAAPSMQSSPRGSPGSVPAPSHTRWLGTQGRQCRWPGPWARRCPTDTAWAGRGPSCRAGASWGWACFPLVPSVWAKSPVVGLGVVGGGTARRGAVRSAAPRPAEDQGDAAATQGPGPCSCSSSPSLSLSPSQLRQRSRPPGAASPWTAAPHPHTPAGWQVGSAPWLATGEVDYWGGGRRGG